MLSKIFKSAGHSCFFMGAIFTILVMLTPCTVLTVQLLLFPMVTLALAVLAYRLEIAFWSCNRA